MLTHCRELLVVLLLMPAMIARAMEMVQMESWQRRIHNNHSGGPWTLDGWFGTWNTTLNNQMESVFSIAESTPVDPGRPQEATLTIAFAWDSTMRMQFQALGIFLSGRFAPDGEPQCMYAPPGAGAFIKCRRAGGGTGGGDEAVGLLVAYYEVKGNCIDLQIRADFIYFGCGLHLLHIIPVRPLEKGALDRWVNYEYYLEQATLSYRTQNEKRLGYLGEVFMMTHSILDHHMTGAYRATLELYNKADEDCVKACLDVVRECLNRSVGVNERALILALTLDPVGRIGVTSPRGGRRLNTTDVCTKGFMGEAAVPPLNKRASEVMSRLNVPIVPAYDIVVGQEWASCDSM